jgi:hypothetical protein
VTGRPAGSDAAIFIEPGPVAGADGSASERPD